MPTLFEALGNAADLPGSMVRDALRLQNPLDQWLTPLTQDNRTSGQDLLDALGVEGDSPWLSMGTEMLLDPLTYVGGSLIGKGLKGLGASSKAASLANALTGKFRTAEEAAKTLRAIPRATASKVRGAVSRAASPSLKKYKQVRGVAKGRIPLVLKPDVREAMQLEAIQRLPAMR